MRFPHLSACLGVVLVGVLLLALPDDSGARRKSCNVIDGSTVIARNSKGVVAMRTNRHRDTYVYGCSKQVGKGFRLFRCLDGQLTSEILQTFRLRKRSVALEIERKPEERNTYFHITRTVSLRTGEYQDVQSASRPQPEGTSKVLEC
jgi:hypothetical protein